MHTPSSIGMSMAIELPDLIQFPKIHGLIFSPNPFIILGITLDKVSVMIQNNVQLKIH